MFAKVLVISPHTDDAEIGAGATIARLVEAGSDVRLVVFSLCEKSIPEGFPKNTLKHEFPLAAAKLGLSEQKLKIFNYPVREFLTYRQNILDDLIKINKELKPSLVIMPSLHDTHQDHQVIANEAVRAFKKDATIIGYEEPWNHITFENILFVRVSEEQLQKKIAALAEYKSQKDTRGAIYFKENFIRSLAVVRGGQINKKLAEAFEVVRWLIK